MDSMPIGHGESLDPHKIGKRTLLAMTCPVCMEFKQGVKFGRHNGYLHLACMACRRKSLKSLPPSHARYIKARQQETKDSASKTRQPYTGADWEILLRDDLTNKQKAIMLGRTYGAVVRQLTKYRRGDATPRRLTEGHPLR